MDPVTAPVLLPSSPTLDLNLYPEDPFVEHEGSDEEEQSRSGRNSSGPDEAVFDLVLDDGQSSPGTSHHSEDDNISELVSESGAASYSMDPESSLYTPHKQRSPFRNPSSVRAIQLDTTPPHLMSGSSKNRYTLNSISRNSTPRSTRSYHSTIRSGKSSPTKKAQKEFPLVLLHVTLLRSGSPYSQELMESVLPSYVIANWKLLQEKISDTVLERGILIPHPRDDYDVLEERLLESLELKIPRILKCGHFHISPEEEEDIVAPEDEYDSDDDADMCQDCGRRIRDGSNGSGTGYRRWDIKIYASNGLMRAGAWTAAWREMERVDVEIMPWIDDSVRRELDLRKAEDNANASPPPVQSAPVMDEQRRREIYGENAQAALDGFEEPPRHAARRRQKEPPLFDLLLNYVRLLLQDQRNVAIVFLAMAVLFLAIGTGRPSAPRAATMAPSADINIPSISALRSAIPEIEAKKPLETFSLVMGEASFVATTSVDSMLDSHVSQEAPETIVETVLEA